MSLVLLGRWSKDRLGKLAGVDQSIGKRNIANRPALLVFGPSGAGKISANDTFHWLDLELFHDHESSAKLLRLRRATLGKIIHLGRDEVMLDSQEVEPEQRKLGQAPPLVLDTIRQDNVKSGEPVGRHNQVLVPEIIEIPNFPPPYKISAGNL